MNIKIDTDALNRCSNTLINVNFELQENMNKIENLILGLGNEWQGDSAKAYQSNILFVKKQFEFLNAFVSDYASNIKQISENFDQAERDLISNLGV